MVFKVRESAYWLRGKSLISFTFSLRPYQISALYIICIFFSPPVLADDYIQELNDFINIEMKPWVNSDIVIDNLNKQNDISANYSESTLKIMDNSWHSEYRKITQPIISQVLGNELSQFLQKKVTDSSGVFTELKIMDSKGLNIAQTIISEDYWNFGKPLWDKTFKEKSYTPYISGVYYSDETSKFQVDVSFMIISSDQPIGVVSAGIDIEQLEDWKKRRK